MSKAVKRAEGICGIGWNRNVVWEKVLRKLWEVEDEYLRQSEKAFFPKLSL